MSESKNRGVRVSDLLSRPFFTFYAITTFLTTQYLTFSAYIGRVCNPIFLAFLPRVMVDIPHCSRFHHTAYPLEVTSCHHVVLTEIAGQ